MLTPRSKSLLCLSIFLAVWAWNVSAAAVKGETAHTSVGNLTAGDIEEQLQVR
jgi:zinc transporter 7